MQKVLCFRHRVYLWQLNVRVPTPGSRIPMHGNAKKMFCNLFCFSTQFRTANERQSRRGEGRERGSWLLLAPTKDTRQNSTKNKFTSRDVNKMQHTSCCVLGYLAAAAIVVHKHKARKSRKYCPAIKYLYMCSSKCSCSSS